MKPHLSREQKNVKYRHTSLEMETSTHFPVLMAAVNATTGPILECGSGLYSTPLLHWMCYPTERFVTTVEKHAHYLEYARKFSCDWHCVAKDKTLDPFKALSWSIVFIDHTPKKPRKRGDDAILMKDSAEYVILHDAGPEPKEKYGYGKVWKHFKYRRDFQVVNTWTTVLSNQYEIPAWT